MYILHAAAFPMDYILSQITTSHMRWFPVPLHTVQIRQGHVVTLYRSVDDEMPLSCIYIPLHVHRHVDVYIHVHVTTVVAAVALKMKPKLSLVPGSSPHKQ